jgi:hypothetical protein
MALRRKQRDTGEALFDASTVDLVAKSPDGAYVGLFIVSDLSWTGSDSQIRSLQEKIHSYVGFAVDGQLAREYPECASLPWRIVVRCQQQPDERTADVLRRTADAVRKHGGDLEVHA